MPGKAASYGDLPPEYSRLDNSRIVIIPVPFDKTSTWKKGASSGPKAIIEASANMELYDIETDSEVYRHGIHTAPAIRAKTAASMLVMVREAVSKALGDGRFPVVIGGDHSVAIGAIEAHADFHGEMSILQLDAHTDFRQSYEGEPLSHACVMARAAESSGNIVQVGIRSMDSSELPAIERERIILAADTQRDYSWIGRVVEMLSDNVYMTIDLDVFDPSLMPSTGTPEPGGLDWYDVMDLIEAVIAERNIVGFDVVELCPIDGLHAPDFLAAKLIYRILSMVFQKRDKEGL